MNDDDTVELPKVTDRGTAARATERRARRRPGAPGHRRHAAAQRPRRSVRYTMIAARVLASITALAVVSGTGFAWSAKSEFDLGFDRTDAIGDDAPRSLGGDLNILLIGLDTRKDLNGNDLPKQILDQLHAGDGDNGGYNANSLILLHIPSDMHKIVAFSIPRDDYVAVTGIPGYDHAKIKESYGLKKAVIETKLENSGVKDKVTLERAGREAGRASIVQTVRNLVGVPIDRFAEISLAGFYDLADALGGVDVCLNHPVDDSYYSGAVFPAGPQHLDAANALSFVRQRHGLENGDLDRTHRQQAFLTSVAKSMKDSGTLTDLGKLSKLMDAAHRDVVLSDGWNLLDFARDLGAAGSISVEFRTLPVLRYDNIDGQDVNIVDPAAIKKEVRAAFGVEQPTTTARIPTSTVDVHNASGIAGRGAALSMALLARGYQRGTVGNGDYADGSSSSISYGPGAETDANQLADLLGLTATASANTQPGHLMVVVGSDFTMPVELRSTATSTATPARTSTTGEPPPDAGKPVATTIGSTVPCVN